MKRNLGRHRVARQTEEVARRLLLASRQASEHNRPAWLHAHAGKEELGALREKRLFDQVVLSHRDAARQHHQVSVAALGDALSDLWSPVACNLQTLRTATGVRDHRGYSVAVGISNLVRGRHALDLHKLVAGGKDSDPRSHKDAQPDEPARGCQGDLGRRDQRARRHNFVILTCFAAACDDVLAGLQHTWLALRNRVARLNDVFNHHHRVRTARHSSAGHDLDRAFGPNSRTAVDLAGTDLPDHRQGCAGHPVSRLDGEAVTRRAVEARLITVRVDTVRKHASQAFKQRRIL